MKSVFWAIVSVVGIVFGIWGLFVVIPNILSNKYAMTLTLLFVVVVVWELKDILTSIRRLIK
jgi:hypothetical protein